MQDFKRHIDTVEDYPQPGITFYDISPLLREHFSECVERMANLFDQAFWDNIDVIAGIDARGFLFASALAVQQQKGVVLIRKNNKLPPPTIQYQYNLEYGSDALEIKQGVGKVLIVDDILATGGTLKAAAELCKKAGYRVNGFATAINLKRLNCFIWDGMTTESVVVYA